MAYSGLSPLQTSPIVEDAIELYGDNPDNLLYPKYAIVLLKWNGERYKFEPGIGGILSWNVVNQLHKDGTFHISFAEINMENTPIVRWSDNVRNLTSDDRGILFGYGDFLTIWGGYRGSELKPLFNGTVLEANPSIKERTVKIKCVDLKNSVLRTFEGGNLNFWDTRLSFGVTIAAEEEGGEETTVPQDLDPTASMDIKDWVLKVVDLFNTKLAKAVQEGVSAPIKIIPPTNMVRTGTIVAGEDLRAKLPAQVDPIELLSELAIRGNFYFDLTNPLVTESWERGVADKDPHVMDLTLEIVPFGNYPNVYLVQEGVDLIEAQFTKGYGRVNVVTVHSTLDNNISATFPDLSSEITIGQFVSQGVLHKEEYYAVTSEEDAKAIAHFLWKTFGGHQEIDITTIGNPFIYVNGWIGLSTTQFHAESIFNILRTEHNFSSSGFITKIKAKGYMYDHEGKKWTDNSKVKEKKQEMDEKTIEQKEAEEISAQSDAMDGDQPSPAHD